MSGILPQVLANSLIAASLYAIASLSFNLIYGAVRYFDVAIGPIAAAGGYAVFYLSKMHGLSFAVAIPAGIIVGALLGYLLERTVYGSLRKKKSKPLVLFVASLGITAVLEAMLAMIFTSQFQSIYVSNLNSTIAFGSASITSIQLISIIVSIALWILVVLSLKYTSIGKAVNAINDDEEVAKIVGINTEKVVRLLYICAGALAAVAGILSGLDIGIEPRMGFRLFLGGATAAVIGGLGNTTGSLVGALILALAENFGILWVASEWKDAIAFVLLIAFLLFRPKGIFKR